jgi:hypothetical protein
MEEGEYLFTNSGGFPIPCRTGCYDAALFYALQFVEQISKEEDKLHQVVFKYLSRSLL